MFSFLSQLKNRSSSLPSSKSSLSNDSTHSFNATREIPESPLRPTFPTPPTSSTDASSIVMDSSSKDQGDQRSSERLRQRPLSIGTYNENVLAGSVRSSTKRKSEAVDYHTISEQKFIDDDSAPPTQLVQEPARLLARLLDPISEQGAITRKSSQMLFGEDDKTMRRSSDRLRVAYKSIETAEETQSVLGRRRRKTIKAGIKTFHRLTRGMAVTKLSGQKEMSVPGEPTRKRIRLSGASDINISSSTVKIGQKAARTPKVKYWLAQGLYVGQDRDFDPRLTEAKNKVKRCSSIQPRCRSRTLLPLPMFAGQRLLDSGRSFKLPFDIFSPLPPGQPKPEEWKRTQKNIFYGDAASVWKKSKCLETSRCVCTPENGCDEDCFNRSMFYECDDSNCNLGSGLCTNRGFEGLKQRTKAGGKYNIGVEVIKTEDRGYGIRSNRSFEAKQIIVEYTGEIITQDECDNRMNKRYKDSECYYLMDFDQQMILDATRGSIARFVNHSCEPNCKMVKWTVAGKPRMALFAGDRGILTGEELTYDYNFNPYSVKNVQECRCGAANCRGILGPKPKEIKDVLKPLADESKRKIRQTINKTSQTTITSKKPKSSSSSSLKKPLIPTTSGLNKKPIRSRNAGSTFAKNQKRRRHINIALGKPSKRVVIRKAVHIANKGSILSYLRREQGVSTTAVVQEKGARDHQGRLKFQNLLGNLRRSSRLEYRGVRSETEKDGLM